MDTGFLGGGHWLSKIREGALYTFVLIIQALGSQAWPCSLCNSLCWMVEKRVPQEKRALGPFLGPQPQAFCSIAFSLSVCGKLRLCGEPAYRHLHHRQVTAPTAALRLCLQCTHSSQDPCICAQMGPEAILCPSSHLGTYGCFQGAGLRVNKKLGAPRCHGT